VRSPFLQVAFLLACFVFSSLTGCTAYFMSVKEGDFDVTLHPTLKGAEYAMDENSSIRRISVDIHRLENQKVKLSKVWTGKAVVCDWDAHCGSRTDYSEVLEPGKADIGYVFKSLPVALSIEWLEKRKIRFISYGFGLDPLPYAKLSVGLNWRYGEIGLSSYFGFDMSNTDYTYEGIAASSPFIQSWPEPEHLTSTYDGYQDHLRGGFGGYASVFLGPVSLTYAPSVHSPWLWTDELGGETAGYADIIPPTDYELTFEFPIYFSNYFGITYNIREKMQFSLGLTVLNGIQLEKRLYFGSATIAYLF